MLCGAILGENVDLLCWMLLWSCVVHNVEPGYVSNQYQAPGLAQETCIVVRFDCLLFTVVLW